MLLVSQGIKEGEDEFLPYVVSHSSIIFFFIFPSSFSIYSPPLHLIPTWLAVSLPPSLIFCLPDIPLSHSFLPFCSLLKISHGVPTKFLL